MSDAIAAGGRERLPYRLKDVVEAVRDFTRDTDAQLDEVIAEFIAALADDGVVDEDESTAILIALMRASKGNANALSVLNLLNESGSEAAQREVERVAAKARRAKVNAK